MKPSPWSCVTALLLASASLACLADDGGAFDPLTSFARFDYPDPPSAYRSASGLPGPAY